MFVCPPFVTPTKGAMLLYSFTFCLQLAELLDYNLWSGDNFWMNWWFFSLSFTKLKFLQLKFLQLYRVRGGITASSVFFKGNKWNNKLSRPSRGLYETESFCLLFFCFCLLFLSPSLWQHHGKKRMRIFQPDLLSFVIEPLWLTSMG